MIEKLKKLLKIHNFSGSVELKDGTQVIVDGNQLEIGVKVYVNVPNNDEPVELPDGEYQLIDDSILVVEGGMVKDILPPVEETEEAPAEEEVEAEEIEEAPVEETPVEETENDLEKKISDLEKRISEIEKMIIPKEEMEKVIQSSAKLQTEFNSIKEKLEKTSNVETLPKTKKVEELSSTDRRYENIKKTLKNN